MSKFFTKCIVNTGEPFVTIKIDVFKNLIDLGHPIVRNVYFIINIIAYIVICTYYFVYELSCRLLLLITWAYT